MLATPENQAAFFLLAKALASESNPPVLFVGAGVSTAAGYPDWKALLDEVHEKISKSTWESAGFPPKFPVQLKKSDDLPWRAEVYQKLLRRTFFNSLLRTTFSPKDSVPDVYTQLSMLPFRHVLTTNYDPSLETLLREKGSPKKLTRIDWTDRNEVTRFFREMRQGESRFYVYLHGRYNSPSSIVLSDSQYVDRYILRDDSNKKLLALFMTQPVVFVGSSFEDEQFKHLFRIVQAHVGSDGTNASHFILSRGSKDPDQSLTNAALLQQKYGIQAVYYEHLSGHEDLTVTLRELFLATGILKTVPGLTPELFWKRFWEKLFGGKKKLIRKSRPRAPQPDGDDPNKGQFGGKAKGRLYELSATVTRDPDEPGWFDIELTVTTSKPSFPGKVIFHLHPTFSKSRVAVRPRGNRATLERWAYGAFTVGVEIEKTNVKLELDLSEMEDAPALFRAR